MSMLKDELIEELVQAYLRGSLITNKHDPYSLGILCIRQERSVISYDIADNVFKFIDSGIDRIFEYTNTLHPKSPRYLEIVPKIEYSIASSGVTSFSPVATSTLDRIIAVDGRRQGLHIFGEHSNVIFQKQQQGIIFNRVELK